MNEIEIIRWIQKIRFPFMDTLMQLLTEIGDQLVFIAIALIIYWFINKKVAFKLVFVFISSAIVNELLKGIFTRNRPYIEDPSLGVGEGTHGYSFPSGHAQNTGVISTVLYKNYGRSNKWLKWVLLSIVIIVPFTRMYLGQHYLTDVIMGLFLGIVLALSVSKLVDLMGDKEHLYGLVMIIPIFAIILTMSFLNQDYEQLKNLFVAAGGLTGFFTGYAIDKKYIQYNFKPSGITIVYRLLVGIIIVGVFYLGLKPVFNLIAEENLYLDYLRYLFVGFGGSALSMYVFKLLKV
ncbi:phosphatase PAP2 family protein [Acholeplasma granularum]|uniref:phosphatase PAP2 family protein n=1 Tax=Acholeplasma granularum TaxID=264635 RepID=UPI0004704A7D|nr:phosphatase PAP2 family protein [Acholeplasma granularum]